MFAPLDGLEGNKVIVVGQSAPTGWNGGINIKGNVMFSAADDSVSIGPGDSINEFIIRSDRPPTIRAVSLTPFWVLVVDNHDDVTDQELEDAANVRRSIPVTSFALGPAEIAVGGFPHYSRLSTEIRSEFDDGDAGPKIDRR